MSSTEIPAGDRESNEVSQIALRSPLAVATLVGAAMFALSRGAYDIFYENYGVSTSEIGLGYVELLTQQAFPLAVLGIAATVVLIPVLRLNRIVREERRRLTESLSDARHATLEELELDRKYLERRYREVERIVGRRRILIAAVGGILVVSTWVAVLFVQAIVASPGPYAPPLGIAPLNIRVHEVIPYWRDPENTRGGTAMSMLDFKGEASPQGDGNGESFLLLGRHDGTTVLHEARSGTTIRVASDSIYLGTRAGR